jgi:tryptophan 2,3-dioxygenase
MQQPSDNKSKITEHIAKLEEKYESMGQDLSSYLEGLLYADYLTYWDYINLDTLLTLQKPITNIPDEKIFIMYHQITELYFKLCLSEFEQIAKAEKPDLKFITDRVNRINRYFENLTRSFDVMVDGMEVQQFMKFRMSLLPASGFQSVQYRMIEICSTDFINLVAKDVRANFNSDSSFADMFENIYWKYGATELGSGKKTLTLKQFEEKYTKKLVELGIEYKDCNLAASVRKLSASEQSNPELVAQLKQLDINVNVNWPLVHLKSAARYLDKKPEVIAATGGTNWQKYLPPRFQKRIFYPHLWNEKEVEEWGKSWIESIIKK